MVTTVFCTRFSNKFIFDLRENASKRMCRFLSPPAPPPSSPPHPLLRQSLLPPPSQLNNVHSAYIAINCSSLFVVFDYIRRADITVQSTPNRITTAKKKIFRELEITNK